MEQLRSKGIKLYPPFIYIVTKIVNSHKKFRTCFNDDGTLGYSVGMSPSYFLFCFETYLIKDPYNKYTLSQLTFTFEKS
nr:CatA-like O-acetyltransferase [Robertmurraya massiliosenegalensis]